MNIELKAMACLLVYPRQQLLDELSDISQAIDNSSSLPAKAKEKLTELIEVFRTSSLSSLQSIYVTTFDLGKKASLNLFEHLHGDSRGRGAAMINLLRLYEDHGLEFQGDELPDFLPAVLEFLSGMEFKDAQMWLQSAAPLISSINRELKLMNSPWVAVTEGLLSFADLPSEEAVLERDDLTPTLDAEWQDQPVTFGGSANPVEQAIRFIDKKVQNS